MARIQIGSHTVEVGDDFLRMSPQDQQSTVDEIEASLGGAPAPANQPPPKTDIQTAVPQADIQQIPQDFQQGLKVGVQGDGRALADVLGAPGDLLNGAANGVLGAYNVGIRKPANYFGADLPEAPRVHPFGGSDEWANLTSGMAESVGYDVLDPDTEMTPTQRLGYNVNRYGAQAATGAAGMTKAAAGMTMAEAPALLRPYVQDAGRAFAGDVGGGVGSGAATHALDEYAPDSIKDNPLVRFATMLLGGVAGSSLPTVAASPVKAVTAAADNLLPADAITKDIKTGITPSRKSANEAAAFLQSKVADRGQTMSDLGEAVRFNREAGGTMPTAGMAAPDPGLRFIEKTAALSDPLPYARRYESVAKDASNDVSRLQLPNADKEAPRVAALSQIADKRAAAEGNVAAQQGQLDASMGQAGTDLTQAQSAEQQLADFYRTYMGGADNASMALDKTIVDDTMKPMTKVKNENFNSIDPNGEQYTSAQPLEKAAAGIRNKAKDMLPSVKGDIAPDQLLKDIESAISDKGDLGIPMMKFKTMNDLRPVVAAKESQARASQQFPLADSFREIKKALSAAADDVAASGGEAGERAKTSLDFYKDTYLPTFGRGEGKALRDAVNTDDLSRSKTPPTKTASRFLKEGAGGREAAADLQRILEKAPNPAEGKAAARSYVLDSLSKSVIGGNGKITETSLQTWINNRRGMLSQMPELADEVNGLLKDVRSRGAETMATAEGGKQSVNRMRSELENAKSDLRRTEDDINKSALSLYVGRDPEKAAAAALSGGDPVAQIKELRTAFTGNKPAEEGFRAAVADHLVNSITNADGERVSYQKLSSAFKKNEKALQEVFGDDVSYLRQAQKRLDMLSRKNVQAVAGSGTVENNGLFARAKKPYELIVRLTYGALTGGSKARSFNLMADQFPNSSNAANDLLKRATLDPRVAKHLLGVDVKEVGTPRWNAKLNRLMGWAEAGRASGKDREDEVGQEGDAKK
jgi:hypothetical protein